MQLYKEALGSVYEVETWGLLEYTVMAKHFERQGQAPYAYHAVRGRGGQMTFEDEYVK